MLLGTANKLQNCSCEPQICVLHQLLRPDPAASDGAIARVRIARERDGRELPIKTGDLIHIRLDFWAFCLRRCRGIEQSTEYWCSGLPSGAWVLWHHSWCS